MQIEAKHQKRNDTNWLGEHHDDVNEVTFHYSN